MSNKPKKVSPEYAHGYIQRQIDEATPAELLLKDELEKITFLSPHPFESLWYFKFQVGFIFIKEDQEKLYILDFYNPDINVGIEANGGYHVKKDGNPTLYTYQKERAFFRANINMISFKNKQIETEISEVIDTLCLFIDTVKNKKPRLEKKQGLYYIK